MWWKWQIYMICFVDENYMKTIIKSGYIIFVALAILKRCVADSQYDDTMRCVCW